MNAFFNFQKSSRASFSIFSYNIAF